MNKGILQYLGNVSMKVHAKLGGVTHHVPVVQAVSYPFILSSLSISLHCTSRIN